MMETHPPTIEDLSTAIVRTLVDVAKRSSSGGTALWIVEHKGGGNLRSQARFVAAGGQLDNETITDEDAFTCDRAANRWLKLLARQESPLWRMLLGQADSQGNFNILPIYPDDPRISELNFDGDALGVAHRMLSE